MNNKELLEKVKEYYGAKDALSKASEKAEAFRLDLKRELEEKFSDLKTNIQRFCGGDSLRSVIKNFCYLYTDILSVQGGTPAYRGSILPPLAFDCENVFAVAGKCVNEIKSTVQTVVARRGDINSQLKSICVDYSTLKSVYSKADGLKALTYDRRIAEEEQALADLKNKVETMRREYPVLEDPDGLKSAFGAFEREKSFSVQDTLSAEEYEHKAPLGFLKEGISDELLTFAVSELGVSPESFSGSPVSLFPESGKNGVFVETDAAFEKCNDGDDFYNLVCKWALSALANFETNAFQLAFIESDNVTKVLEPIAREISSVSADYLYSEVASVKDRTMRLLRALIAEQAERQTVFRTVRCRSITEYNAKNEKNPMKYVLIMVHGYPELFADAEARQLLKKLVLEGGERGFMTVLIGKNETVAGPYGGKGEKLDLEELGMSYLTIGADGAALLDGAPFDTELLARDVDFREKSFDRLKASMKKRVEEANVFPLSSIAEWESSRPIWERLSIPAGDQDGKLYSLVSATEKPPYPFTLVTGGTGSGKSAFLHTLMMSGAMKYSPEELEYYIVDFKTKDDSREFLEYVHKDGVENLYIPHVKYLSLRARQENALDVVEYIKFLMNERNKLGKFKEYNSRPEVRSGQKKRMPFALFIIDEYENMLTGGDSKSSGGDSDIDTMFIGKRIVDGLTTVLKRARTFGIGVIFSGQAIKLPDDAMNQISNRIAFYNGNEIFGKMFSEWKDGMIDRFPERYAGYAYCAENANVRPVFTKMAYSGATDGKEMKAIAARIREKYKESQTEQVVVGVAGSAELQGGSTYHTWAEEKEYRVELARQENPEDFERGGQEEGYANERPLAVGVSASASLPVHLEFSKGANGFNYFACANANVLSRVEQNAASSFIFQTTVVGNGARIIYGGSRKSFDRTFGPLIAKNPFLTDKLELVEGEVNIARRLLKLHESETPSPVLVILHDVEWLEPDKILKWLPKHSEEETAPQETTSDENYLDMLKASGVDFSDELLAEVAEMNIALGALDAVAEREKERKFTKAELEEAFKELYMHGNRKEIFLLVTAQTYATLNSVVLSMATDTKVRASLCDHAVYGSYDEMKAGLVNDNASANCCYVRPAATRVRLFDYDGEAAGEWWSDLEKRIKGEEK